MHTPRDSYVHKHPGSANLYYIRDIPEDVRHLLPTSRNGKPRTKWKISLKSAIRREAAITARKLAAEHDAFIEIGRAPDPLSTLTDQERAALDSERRQIERQLARDVPVAKAIGGSSKKLQKAGFSYLSEAVAKNPSDPEKISASIAAIRDRVARREASA